MRKGCLTCASWASCKSRDSPSWILSAPWHPGSRQLRYQCRTGRGPLALPNPPPIKASPRPSRAAKKGATPFMAATTNRCDLLGLRKPSLLHLSHILVARNGSYLIGWEPGRQRIVLDIQCHHMQVAQECTNHIYIYMYIYMYIYIYMCIYIYILHLYS